jgi:SDR family mycofactocin-dependent oxidoreductase
MTSQDTPPVALVTGAARGIGAATVRALLADGWSVVATDLCADDPAIPYRLGTRGELDAVVAAGGERCVALDVDVRDQYAIDAAVRVAVDQFGGLDAAVAVAGVLRGGEPAWETDETAWGVQLDVNLTGAWRLARAAVPVLLTRPEPRRGRFIGVSSAAGVKGLPLLAAYSASKHGLVGLVTSMAVELGPHGICANVICPGSTAGPLLDASADVYGLAGPEEFLPQQLLPELLQPEQVAGMIAFLCGPGGSGVTGAVIPVDAGMDAR